MKLYNLNQTSLFFKIFRPGYWTNVYLILTSSKLVMTFVVLIILFETLKHAHHKSAIFKPLYDLHFFFLTNE